MRKRIIDWFFTLQSQRGILGEKERRFYTYAYGLLLNKIATVLCMGQCRDILVVQIVALGEILTTV